MIAEEGECQMKKAGSECGGVGFGGCRCLWRCCDVVVVVVVVVGVVVVTGTHVVVVVVGVGGAIRRRRVGGFGETRWGGKGGGEGT